MVALHRFLLSRLDEGPGLESQQQQRNDFHRRESRAQDQVRHRGTAKIKVVHRADNAAERVRDDIQINHAQGPLPGG